jgi:hypothetical protein
MILKRVKLLKQQSFDPIIVTASLSSNRTTCFLCKRFQIPLSHWFCGHLTHNFKSTTHKIVQSTQFSTWIWMVLPYEKHLLSPSVLFRFNEGFHVGFHVDVLHHNHPSPWYLPPRPICLQGSPLHLARYVQSLLNYYIVYMAKRLVIFAPTFTKKSPFLCARLKSITMAISAYGKDCLYCLRDGGEWAPFCSKRDLAKFLLSLV